MNQSEGRKDAVLESVDSKKDSKSHSVADYLQAPRRKKKSYIITALAGKTLDYQAGMEAFIKAQMPSMNVGHAKSEDDLRRFFRRQVLLVVIDDEFLERERVIDLALMCKVEKKDKNTPFLFLTKNPSLLIDLYREKMGVFHEGDDYINYTRTNQIHINSRLKYGLSVQFRRRGRRYGNQITASYFSLHDQGKRLGVVSDISLNGCYLQAKDDHLFRLGEQLILHIHLPYSSQQSKGEFLHISCRVRRISISGSGAGLSFEYLSEAKRINVLEFVTYLARTSLIRTQSDGKQR